MCIQQLNEMQATKSTNTPTYCCFQCNLFVFSWLLYLCNCLEPQLSKAHFTFIVEQIYCQSIYMRVWSDLKHVVISNNSDLKDVICNQIQRAASNEIFDFSQNVHFKQFQIMLKLCFSNSRRYKLSGQNFSTLSCYYM